jgi:ubiquinone/menaquinone biosynthesis C-methylase UbiE
MPPSIPQFCWPSRWSSPCRSDAARSGMTTTRWALAIWGRSFTVPETEGHRVMSDTESVAVAQRTFWNSEATRRWVTEQSRIDQLMSEVTEAALSAAAPVRGERVLDIGCGTGTTVLRLAEAVGPSGRVLGVDISDQQLGLARQRVATAGAPQVQLVLDDAATHRFQPETIDLGFSRFGVMFFANPVAAFSNIRHGMKRSGRLLLTVFRSGTENPWATAAVAAIQHLVPPVAPLGPEEPGQFSWGDAARVRRILEGGGFREVVLTPLDVSFSLGRNAAEAAEFATFIGQGARLLHGQPEETRQAARVAFEEFFMQHEGANGVTLPGALWLVSARA